MTRCMVLAPDSLKGSILAADAAAALAEGWRSVAPDYRGAMSVFAGHTRCPPPLWRTVQD